MVEKKYLEFIHYGIRIKVLHKRVLIGWLVEGDKFNDGYFKPLEGIEYMDSVELRQIADKLDEVNIRKDSK